MSQDPHIVQLSSRPRFYGALPQLVNGSDMVPVLFNTLGQLLAGLLAVYLGVIFARSLGGI
jgi:fluoride ion exporter CrcB/FEX